MRASFLFVLFALSQLVLNACSKPPSVVTLSGSTMGTRYHITLASYPKALELEQLQKEIDNALQAINQLMSTYIVDSELSLLNQAKVGEWFQLSPETFTVLEYSLSLSKKTQGKFDVTVAPLINLWGFGHKGVSAELPSNRDIKQVMALIGWRFLELNPSLLQVKKNKAVTIDLSAVAKGYGVDHIALLLEQKSIDNYLVEIGGEVRVKGVNKAGDLWRIGIETPSAHQSGVQKVIALNNKAVATSGDYRNFFEKEDVRYSHTIDPSTGRPVIHNIASLTVISDSAMEADALATAFMVMGEDRALAMAKVYNIPIYLLLYDNNAFTASYSPAFADYIESLY